MGTRPDPIDIEINSPFLPYVDLDLKGDPKRNLRIPNDVLLTLSQLTGLSNGTPRVAQMSPSGSLYVTEAGGGLELFTTFDEDVVGFDGRTKLFPQTQSGVYIRSDGSDFVYNFRAVPGLLNLFGQIRVPAGFQVFIPVTFIEMGLSNLGATTGHYNIWGFIQRNVG